MAKGDHPPGSDPFDYDERDEPQILTNPSGRRPRSRAWTPSSPWMVRPGLDRRHHDVQQLLVPDDQAGPRPSGRSHAHRSALCPARARTAWNHAGAGASDRLAGLSLCPTKQARASGAARLTLLVRSRRVPDRSSGTWTRAKAVPWRPAFRAKQGAGRSGGTSDARRKQDQASPVNARGGNVPRHDRSAASYGSPGDNTRSTGWGPVNVRAGPRLRREWPRCWRRRSPLGRGSARW